MMTTETQASETTVDDHLRNLIQLMKRGARLKLFDLPDDPSFLSSNIGGGMSQAIADRLEAALSAAEPVATKLRMIVSHATMGQTDGEGLSTNDICVKITALRNELSKRAQSTAPSVAVKALEWAHVVGDVEVAGSYKLDRMRPWTGDKPRKYWVQVALGFGFETIATLCKTVDEAKAAAQADYESRILSALSAQVQDARSDDEEETYQIGVRDGYSQAAQEIDRLTGGDGEYRYCTDHDPERHTPGPCEMIQRIVDRFETLNLIGEAEKRGDFWDVPGSAQVQDVAGWQLVPKDDESRCVADSALPHEMIEAGIRIQEQVNDDHCNYVAGETTDWDCGMVAVAIYRAMLAAAPAKQEG